MKAPKVRDSAFVNYLRFSDPAGYKKVLKEAEPIFQKDQLFLIPQIHERIQELHPELDRTGEGILCAGCVYTWFAPLTMKAVGLDRAVNGLREEICKVMNYTHATSVNAVQEMARVQAKGVAGIRFNKMIKEVGMPFLKYSRKSMQSELDLK